MDKKSYLSIAIAMLILAIIYGGMQMSSPGQQGNNLQGWAPVENAVGRNGTLSPDGIFMISFLRTDVNVTIGNIWLNPAMGLDSWVAFQQTGDHAMLMGDLVLTEDEIGPVRNKILEVGMNVTAIHNTLIGESPRVIDLHIEGDGDPVEMAKNIHDALLLSSTPFNATSIALPENNSLSQENLDHIMGNESTFKNGIYEYQVPRNERIMSGGMEVPASLDVATTIKFQPLSGDMAAITGDFALTANEVGPVIDTLTAGGIDVVAIHHHMLDEEPRLFYLHFWKTGNTYELARGLRAAVLKTNSTKNSETGI